MLNNRGKTEFLLVGSTNRKLSSLEIYLYKSTTLTLPYFTSTLPIL